MVTNFFIINKIDNDDSEGLFLISKARFMNDDKMLELYEDEEYSGELVFKIQDIILILAVLTWQQLIKNNMYGAECVEKAEASKKSNFADQLKLLQQNAESVEATDGGEAETGGSKEYNDIFGDPNLFKNFGGFDTDKKEEGESGATRSNEYNDIFSDPNLFKNFGGFDNKE